MREDTVIAFDFDGVIASYAGFVGKEHIEEPNAEIVKAIKLLKDEGCKILIHSTRGNDFIQKYCEAFEIPFDYINRRPDKQGDNPGKPIAFVYIDDRAVCYKGQSAEALISEIKNFKPYWQSSES